ncbi:exocyst complex component 3-like protein [Protopterus annectens]|uniref:exocyst complex component 3-like protein n=1 Tax=Protopterus annectens TaxID=7888 RepID=UPI001CFB3846|nr:exocyst complex component 3-like protein [Protopterus annectens]
MGSDLIDNVCMVLDHYCKCFGRVKEPIYQILLQECQHVVVVEYLRALMEKRMVCRNSEERSQFSDKMTQDSLQLNDFFCKMGLEKSEPIMNVIPLVSDLIRVTDTTLLSLQVSDLVMKYPDISDEHVSVLLDIRGDVSKETRMTVLELLQENSRTLPEGYQSVFSNILVPTPAMAFCIPAVKCT